MNNPAVVRKATHQWSNPQWFDDAECAKMTYDEYQGKVVNVYDPEIFFPAGETGMFLLIIDEAKAVCAKCPVSDKCYEWIMDIEREGGLSYTNGIYAGLTERERKAIFRKEKRKSNRGRKSN